MKRVVLALLGLLLSCAAFAENRSLLVVSEIIQIKAEPAKVWNMLKPFDGLKNWHPLFSGSEIVSGKMASSAQSVCSRSKTARALPKSCWP
jgi:mxaD protein